MFRIWTLEREDGGVDYFTREEEAIKALNRRNMGPYKATAVPKMGHSEHADYDFVKVPD